MNNLEPRAKIGDVVIVKGIGQCKIDGYKVEYEKRYYFSVINPHYSEVTVLKDKDILKNLTTNVSYE